MVPPDNIKNFFGEHAEFEHAGIAVKSISDAAKDAEITEDPIQKVKVAFIDINTVSVAVYLVVFEDICRGINTINIDPITTVRSGD